MSETKTCPHCGGTGLVEDPVVFGQKMRQRRIKKGKSLREVAKLMGITEPYLSDLERGRRHFGTKQRYAFRCALAGVDGSKINKHGRFS